MAVINGQTRSETERAKQRGAVYSIERRAAGRTRQQPRVRDDAGQRDCTTAWLIAARLASRAHAGGRTSPARATGSIRRRGAPGDLSDALGAPARRQGTIIMKRGQAADM